MTTTARRTREVWRRLAGSGSTANASLGLLVFCCVFLAMAGPRANLGYRTSALQGELAGTPLLSRSVVGNVDYTGYLAGMHRAPGARDLAVTRAHLSAYLRRHRVALREHDRGWSTLTTDLVPVYGLARRITSGGKQTPQMELAYRPSLASRAHLSSGRYPRQAHKTGHRTVLEVAVTRATASRFGLRPGSQIDFPPSVTMLVTGVLSPRQANSAFWASDPVVAAPILEKPTQTPAYWVGGAFVAPAEVPLLPKSFDPANMRLAWVFPLALGQLTAESASGLQNALIGAGSRVLFARDVGNAPVELASISLSSGVSSTLAEFAGQDRAAGRVLNLLAVSLAVIAAVVVALGAQLVAERRRRDLEVVRSRGASLGQLALIALTAGAVPTVPAAVAGGALGLAVTPGPAAPLAWRLAALIVVVALASLPVIVARHHRNATAASRPARGRPAGRQGARRLLAEVALVAAALGGLVVLRQQANAATSSGGVYASMAPVLVAVPAAIVVMRCCPLLVRGLLRLSRVRPGVAAFMGFARAAMAPAVAALPVFALVLALSVVAFGATVSASIRHGEVADSWQRVGADAVIDASTSTRPITPALQRTVDGVPGVEQAAGVVVLAGSAHGTALTVAAVRPSRYAALLAATPAGGSEAAALARRVGRSGSAAAPVPALATPAAAKLLREGKGRLDVGTRPHLVRVVGTANPVPGLSAHAVVVVPEQEIATRSAAPTLLLAVGSGLNGNRLAQVVHRALPDATVTLRARILATLAAQPLPHSATVAVIAGTAMAGGLSALIIFIALILGARSRWLTLVRLRVLGLGRGQADWLVAVEVLPQILAAAAGGIACAWVMGPLVGPSLDLSVFTGGRAEGIVRAEPGWLAAAAVGLVVLAGLILAAEIFFANRSSAGRVLRQDE